MQQIEMPVTEKELTELEMTSTVSPPRDDENNYDESSDDRDRNGEQRIFEDDELYGHFQHYANTHTTF